MHFFCRGADGHGLGFVGPWALSGLLNSMLPMEMLADGYGYSAILWVGTEI